MIQIIFTSFLSLCLTTSFVWADSPVVPAGTAPVLVPPPGQPGGILGMALPFLLMFAVLYFLMIRPQQKKMKAQQAMMNELKHGDEVITNSGLLGKITGITDKVITLEVDTNVRIKMLKSQVSQVLKGPIKELT